MSFQVTVCHVFVAAELPLLEHMARMKGKDQTSVEKPRPAEKSSVSFNAS
jgi:hypothetical protein